MNKKQNETMPYVTVIGGINCDIEAKSFGPLISRDSNPGRVSTALGGVGFNIARNLCLMGTRVKMLTALGDDENRARIDREAERFGLDLSEAVTIPGARTQTYLYICGPDGDMELAVNDMELLHVVDEAYLASRMDIINGSACVVADANLDRSALEYLAENCRVPIFVDPVSVAKIDRVKNILGKLYGFKPNRIEGEMLAELLGAPHSTSLAQITRVLMDAGIKRLYLSLGKDGVYCTSAETGESFIKPCITRDMANATGGGDAMMAALVKGYLMGLNDEDTASLALAASALAVECPHTVNFDITLEKVLERAGLKIGQ